MAGSITLPFSSTVRLYGKVNENGRAVMEFDRAAGKSSDMPKRNAVGAPLFRHPALLQLEEGADMIDVTVICDREQGLGPIQPVALDPADARITVSSQRDAFDLRVSVSGTWAPARKATT